MTPVIIAIVAVVAIGILAALNIPVLSVVLRTWWNISFMIAAYIPFCGWMAHFIIAKDDKWRARKAKFVSVGEKNDAAVGKMASEAVERQKREEEARQAQLLREQETRQALEDELNAAAYKKYGTRNVSLNSDGSMAKVGDGDYISTEEMKKNLR